ncbi:MAG: MFS transporter, partial [Methylobacteriaceae bacterium]|nr:MFS transporter [Methylobacteriaceae bacterium]
MSSSLKSILHEPVFQNLRHASGRHDLRESDTVHMSGSAITDLPARPVAPPTLAVLVAISAMQPLTMNVLVPAMPGLAKYFGVDYSTVQLTLMLYLIGVALSQLVAGPISDRVGRRPVLLWSLGIYVLGGMLAAAASSILTVIVARVLQAFGAGTTFALARAVVRDTCDRDQAASRLGYVSAVTVLGSMVAPLVGGAIDQDFGWRSIFGVSAVFGVAISALTFAALRETNLVPAKSFTLAPILRSFPVLLSDRSFTVHAAVMCLASGTMFCFISGAPYIVVEVMKRTPEVYGAYYLIGATGFMAGTFLAGRWSRGLG